MSADKHKAKARRLLLLRKLFPTSKPPFFPADRVSDVESLTRLVSDGLVKIVRGDHHSMSKNSCNKRTYIERVGGDK